MGLTNVSCKKKKCADIEVQQYEVTRDHDFNTVLSKAEKRSYLVLHNIVFPYKH